MASDIDRLVAAARQWPSGGDSLVEAVSTSWSRSHSLFAAELDGRRVIVKVFTDIGRDEHLREWDGLCDLADDGLAAEPIFLAFDGGPPAIIMSRVAGCPRRLAELTASQVEVFAAAHRRVHAVQPRPPRPANGTPGTVLTRTLEALTALTLTDDPLSPTRAQALGLAAAWIRSVAAAWDRLWDLDAYCRGDSNWGNYLWSEDRVMLVDFEDAGLNDRAFELADIVEHVANRDLPSHGVEQLAALWGLDRRGSDLLAARRLIACFWLTLLEGAERRCLPPRQVAADEQARHTLDLLS